MSQAVFYLNNFKELFMTVEVGGVVITADLEFENLLRDTQKVDKAMDDIGKSTLKAEKGLKGLENAGNQNGDSSKSSHKQNEKYPWSSRSTWLSNSRHLNNASNGF